MSIKNNSQELLFTANNELQGFLPKNHPMRLFSEEIYPLFSDEDFLECYSNSGRPAISPSFLACVTILQFQENMSDSKAAEACIMRIDWKHALHLPLLLNSSFDSSTLVNFRKRLRENKKMSFLFDKILEMIKEKGFIKKESKQRIDATNVIAHVNRISTTDLLFRSVKCVVEELEQKFGEFYGAKVPSVIQERYSSQFSSFGMSKEKRNEKQIQIAKDGIFLKKIIENYSSEMINEVDQLKIMETIFEENIKITYKETGKKEIVEVEEVMRPKQTIFNPRDVDIQLGIKGRKSWVGSKCHIVETADKGKQNFITDMIYQSSRENDILIHDKFIEGCERNNLKPKKIYADSAYISGAAIHTYSDNNQELRGFIKLDGSLKPTEFKQGKFNIDLNNRFAICPQKKKSIRHTIDGDGTVRIIFDKNDCINCQFYKDCAGNKKREKARVLHVNKDYKHISERRIEQKSKKFKKEMSVRAQVEGSISEMTRFHGLRKAKYCRKAGHQLQFYLTGASVNTKRYFKAIVKQRQQSMLTT